MSDIGLLLTDRIITRLYEARSLRINELRNINRTIVRLESLRRERIQEIRQRAILRERTYNNFPEPAVLEQEQADFLPAPTFPIAYQDTSNPEDDQENIAPDGDEDQDIPELEQVDELDIAAAEQRWIEERGYLSDEEADLLHLTSDIARRLQGRRNITGETLFTTRVVERFITPGRHQRERANRNRERARRNLLARLDESAEAITLDILEGIVRGL